ncbi:DNA-J related domain-containing protein [Pseudoalteromonas umbrosa]|uniref:DNA-J related domain-containing protein n=1 Tax=Pseudoalteromonas umbrosa TaxID=3048489 RepID=UPI0024C23523|nr:DNA-J related domain-containing protein [Pseudoalteromonas sp. B95]MDK1290415.1 DNA-J related domain-containing protein [Pseudoalteromonas sp. B95]
MFTDRTMTNPLLDIIFEIISTGEHLKVHELASRISKNNALPELDSDPHKELFKKNFLIMNALYQLQHELQSSGYDVHISNLDIYLQQKVSAQTMYNEQALQKADPLKDYYLDWYNYDTNSDEIEALLNGFWKRYASHVPMCTSERTQLLKKWQLSEHFCATELQKRWRQLAIENHPDKGGSTRAFQQIKSEYEQLKGCL